MAQEIFIRLIEVLRSNRVQIGEGAAKFRRYLATLIRNELINLWRRRSARGGNSLVPVDDPAIETQMAVDSEVVAVIDAKWRLARRLAAVEWTLSKTALSTQSKEVYRAYVLEERPIADVAAAFGISRNAVSQIKTRVERDACYNIGVAFAGRHEKRKNNHEIQNKTEVLACGSYVLRSTLRICRNHIHLFR